MRPAFSKPPSLCSSQAGGNSILLQFETIWCARHKDSTSEQLFMIGLVADSPGLRVKRFETDVSPSEDSRRTVTADCDKNGVHDPTGLFAQV